jgi:ABC-2 type transport system permease protein
MKKVKKYFKIFKINFSNELMYVINYVSTFLFFGVVLIVFSQLWRAIYSENPVIEGFTYEKMIWYFMYAETVMLSRFPFVREIADEIKSGDIAYRLNKPYSYILYYYSKFISSSILKLFLNTLVGITILTIAFKGYPMPLIGLILGFTSAIIGLSIHFVFHFFIALSAMWFEDNTAFLFVYSKILLTIGGLFIPIEMFPETVKIIANALPFKHIIYTPATIYINGAENFLKLFSTQIFTLLILSVVVAFAFEKSKKRFNVNGG